LQDGLGQDLFERSTRSGEIGGYKIKDRFIKGRHSAAKRAGRIGEKAKG